jgi:two-component system nitrate/nitrite response regulator NarL
MVDSVGADGAAIEIILADAQAVYRLGILQVFESETDMQVVAHVDSLVDVKVAIERFFGQSLAQDPLKIAIILVEGSMISGTLNAIAGLVHCAPQTRIIVHLEDNKDFNSVELYRCGVSGIVPRSISPDLLVKCVRKVAAGETWIDNRSVNGLIEAYQVQTKLLDGAKKQPRLSTKERVVITYITEGKRNKEIAYMLGTTEQVIKNYLRKIYYKLGVSDRLELALYALRHESHRRVSDRISAESFLNVPDRVGSENGPSRMFRAG